MFGTKTLAARRARRVQLAARTVALSCRIERAKLEVSQLAARYCAFGLDLSETPGLSQALVGVRSLMDTLALTELELASV
jgi:hypothetical protein